MSTPVLGGRYRLVEIIGGGGMGEVWRAHDDVLDRDVAVKVIRSHLAESETVRARLRLEARLAGSLRHPGIVDVFDYGEHDDGGRTVPFVVMPLIDGVPLSELVNSAKVLTAGETMAIVSEVADALEVSHTAGIVHRDLKPGNILLARSGRVMLVDFGIARSSDGEPLTETGALLGTVAYLSPEQCAGRSATAASDLYGLGVVAYACLTGTLPFHRDSDIATALAQMQDPLPQLPEDVPAAARDLVHRLLEKDPADRPTSAAEVAETARALATTLPALPDAEPAVQARPAGATLAAVSDATQQAAVGAPRRSYRTVLMGAATLVAVASAFWLTSVRGSDRVDVPSVKGDTAVEASAELARAGLKVKKKDVDVANTKAGEVVKQSPAAGTRVDEDTVVTISVATGRVVVPVKDLLGSSYARARDRLDDMGLKSERVDMTSTKPAGTVIAVDPSTRVDAGDTIELTVARARVVVAPTEGAGRPSGGGGDDRKKDAAKDEPQEGNGKPDKDKPGKGEPTEAEPTEAEPSPDKDRPGKSKGSAQGGTS